MHHDARRYWVKHVTEYTYDEPVTKSFSRAMLRPRETPYQRVVEHDVEISPVPSVLEEHVDAFGNFVHHVEIDEPHTVLSVSKTATLDIEWPRPDFDALDRWTVASAVAEMQVGAAVDPFEVSAFRLPSKLVTLGSVEREFAHTLLRADIPFGEAIRTVYERINHDFTYASGSTTVSTTLPEVIEEGKGVCQDFAHLAAMVFRVFGVPCRYVSGYIETYPAPGQEKLEGSDASHAWVSVLTPDGTWVDVDPTNDQPADSRYLVTAWGRDFRDVSPLKGIIFADNPTKSKLDVGVTVKRVDEA